MIIKIEPLQPKGPHDPIIRVTERVETYKVVDNLTIPILSKEITYDLSDPEEVRKTWLKAQNGG